MRFLLVMLLALSVAPAHAGPDTSDEARVWLERMATAMREMSYQGTFVYVRDEDVDTMRITHVNTDGEVHERMVSISGPHREVIRDGNGVRCALGEEDPGMKAALATGSVFPEFDVEAFRKVQRHYRFELGKKDRVAGRVGQQVRIVPQDQYRNGYDLWLDEDSGLLLRWVLFNPKHKLLAKLVFTELRTGDQVDVAELKSGTAEKEFIELGQRDPMSPAPKPGPVIDTPLAPMGLPPGYQLVARASEPGAGGGELTHWVYSDGLAAVSVYIESGAGERADAGGLSRMGTTNAWTEVVDGRMVTAIGEVPPLTVKRIGKAFSELPELP
ncbi:MucB/RseB C-terminal domain-containing protein [Marinihelvus fidelis]|nr:MucB/RseB C-terminal domain-containing protein [Marinihelvus fidelis]